MVDVLTEITINAPIENVSAYAMNPDNATHWYENINSAVWITDKPLIVSSKIAFKARFLYKDLSYTYEIKELETNKLLVMQTADGPFPMQTTYTFEPITKQSTKMTLRNTGNPKGFSLLFKPIMTWAMKRANNKDLKKIKEILEAKNQH
jgi:uncharacterized membrane protein